MLALDCEMTGLEPKEHSIVSIGVVDMDHPERQLYLECRAWDGAKIEDEALEINGFTREQVLDASKMSEGEAVQKLIEFAKDVADITIAGQNVFTDQYFLQAAAKRAGHTAWPFAHRIIDIHTLCYEHMVKRGVTPPFNAEKRHTALNLDAVLNYCGIPAEPEPHNALTGAKCNAEVISRLLYGKKLLSEFEQYPIPF